MGSVADSYMTNGVFIWLIFAHFLIYYEDLPHILFCILSQFPYI
jgi:hypothetical protein